MSFISSLFAPIGKGRDSSTEHSEPPDEKKIDAVEFEEVKVIPYNDEDGIIIYSSTNIIISETDSNEYTLKIHGVASSGYKVNLVETQVNKRLLITARKETDETAREKSKEASREASSKEIKKEKTQKSQDKKEDGTQTSNEEEENALMNTTLEIEIPKKRINKIMVRNSNGTVIIKSSVHAKIIGIENKNGDVHVKATFEEININASEGSVNIESVAESNVNICIGLMVGNGSVNLSVENIRYSYLNYEIKGGCIVCPKLNGIYNLTGNIFINGGSFIFR